MLLLMALILSCMSMAAVDWWLESRSARQVLAMLILLYVFGLVGMAGLLSVNNQRALVWLAAVMFATVPLGLLFTLYGSPI